jgi:hypothetical protein
MFPLLLDLSRYSFSMDRSERLLSSDETLHSVLRPSVTPGRVVSNRDALSRGGFRRRSDIPAKPTTARQSAGTPEPSREALHEGHRRVASIA